MATYFCARNVTAVQTIANMQKLDGTVAGPNQAILNASSTALAGPGSNQGFQVTVTGSGNVSCTIQPVASNDGINWVNNGSTIAAGSAANVSSAIGQTTVTNAYVGAFVTAITGTNASANITVSF